MENIPIGPRFQPHVYTYQESSGKAVAIEGIGSYLLFALQRAYRGLFNDVNTVVSARKVVSYHSAASPILLFAAGCG